MPKDVAVLAVHGMGDTEEGFDERLKAEIRDALGAQRWRRVCWRKVFYQKVLQENQRRLMRSTIRRADVDWIKLRRFVLFSLSDAAGMEFRREEIGSVYEQVQIVVLRALESALGELADARKPVVVVAHSLGGQVVSNYIWDAQRPNASAGVFADSDITATDPEDKFRRLKTLRYLFTSGCNIPAFVAGLPESRIKPITVNGQGWQFRWENYYDPDDALGWPLHPINAAYRAAVAVDKAVNVGGPLNSWTPMSHNQYWKDDDFLEPVIDAVKTLL